MPNYRDTIRSKLAEASAYAANIGINLNDARRESRGDQATGAMISRLANAPTPTEGHERIYPIDFAGQTYDGTNTEFTLPRRVLGQNILLWRIDQATGTAIPLTKTSNPAPSGNQFWFDDLFTVRVGTPPQSLDGLLGALVTTL